ncbi:hypothetical protein [Aestuariirhabdus litorea]|uniref:Uncharacterized protein n=1 Tax=Aestuariirhabdus litorea TaxID=2528527 RepID=A0A3P3VQU1_9GAMM|nr:hypothetical protein [Aestuariirhabdus litorea]RRJ84824.1 hypothetical protein D0544_06955 [Aestuariirhabdus litorea]RWW98049.1 hypothetical protein DZC74_06950 [Endozoicomonadaceae bacterium GTF-13]
MIPWTLSLSGYGLLLFCLLPRSLSSHRLLSVVGIVLILLLPLPLMEGVALIDLLRGGLGDFSILTLGLLTMSALERAALIKSPVNEAQWRMLSLLTLLVAIPFYTFSLGVGLTDPYRWGFSSALVLPLGALTLAMVYLRCWWAVALFCLALLLWILEWGLESRNLWDYLLDPMLVFYAAAQVLRDAVKSLGRKAADTP